MFLQCLAKSGLSLAHGREALKASNDAGMTIPALDQMIGLIGLMGSFARELL